MHTIHNNRTMHHTIMDVMDVTSNSNMTDTTIDDDDQLPSSSSSQPPLAQPLTQSSADTTTTNNNNKADITDLRSHDIDSSSIIPLSTSTSTISTSTIPMNSQLILVQELQQQLQSLQRLLVQRAIELETNQTQLQQLTHEKNQYQQKYDELLTYLQRLKKMNMIDSSSAPSTLTTTTTSSSTTTSTSTNHNNHIHNVPTTINFEYLKNCIYKFLISTNYSEKQRLLPVLATLLSLTPKEKEQASRVLTQLAEQEQSGGVSLTQLVGVDVVGVGVESTSLVVESISSAFSWFGGYSTETTNNSTNSNGHSNGNSSDTNSSFT
jgi:hypothetical protein